MKMRENIQGAKRTRVMLLVTSWLDRSFSIDDLRLEI